MAIPYLKSMKFVVFCLTFSCHYVIFNFNESLFKSSFKFILFAYQKKNSVELPDGLAIKDPCGSRSLL